MTAITTSSSTRVKAARLGRRPQQKRRRFELPSIKPATLRSLLGFRTRMAQARARRKADASRPSRTLQQAVAGVPRHGRQVEPAPKGLPKVSSGTPRPGVRVSAAMKLHPLLLSASLAFTASILQTRAAEPETVWLSSLELSPVVQGWGKAQADKAVTGKPISIGGKNSSTGSALTRTAWCGWSSRAGRRGSRRCGRGRRGGQGPGAGSPSRSLAMARRY